MSANTYLGETVVNFRHLTAALAKFLGSQMSPSILNWARFKSWFKMVPNQFLKPHSWLRHDQWLKLDPKLKLDPDSKLYPDSKLDQNKNWF